MEALIGRQRPHFADKKVEMKMTSTACLKYLRVQKWLQMTLVSSNFHSKPLMKKENTSFSSNLNQIKNSLEMRSTSLFTLQKKKFLNLNRLFPVLISQKTFNKKMKSFTIQLLLVCCRKTQLQLAQMTLPSSK